MGKGQNFHEDTFFYRIIHQEDSGNDESDYLKIKNSDKTICLWLHVSIKSSVRMTF